MKKVINSPRIGSIVCVGTFRRETNKNYPCDALIVGGQYLINGRISNWWEWRRIKKDGSLCRKESGYGDFTESISKYKIKIKILNLNNKEKRSLI